VICVQIEEFLTKLGIRSTSLHTELAGRQLPIKQKLKTAKAQLQDQSEDESLPEQSKTSVPETKKKSNKLQYSEISTTTKKAVDWIANYQPRKYLLVKPCGKWYSERVSCSFQYPKQKKSAQRNANTACWLQ